VPAGDPCLAGQRCAAVRRCGPRHLRGDRWHRIAARTGRGS
jgi:hypothetical protein